MTTAVSHDNKKYIPSWKISKKDPVWKYSNPHVSQNKSYRYLGKRAILYRSTKKDKKYMIADKHGKMVHFGQMKYEDFTKHKSRRRRQNYLARSTKIRGDWKHDPYSPNNLSIRILW